MSKDYLTCTETAKLVRAALKRSFPGVKFSVRSNSYAGGASIDVSWTDGPLTAAVDAATGCYAGAGFDGMIDLKTHNSSWLYPDGTTERFQTEIGHSYGSRTWADGEPVTDEDVNDFTAGIYTEAAGSTTRRYNPDSLAFRRGKRYARDRMNNGARLVSFGADYIFTSRERSPAEERRLQDAVVILSGSGGPFSHNERYSFGVEVPGVAYEGYGSDLVHRLAQIEPERVAAAVDRERERRRFRQVEGRVLTCSSGKLEWREPA